MIVDGGIKLSELDSKKKSASEALVNALGGFPVGYGLGIIILPISTGWIQEDPYMANIAITGVYAAVSFVRSYFLRRIFEKYGIDDNFIRLAKRGIVKLMGQIR
jgi:hypothetical protein